MRNFYVTESFSVDGGGGDAELEVETEVEVDYDVEPSQRGDLETEPITGGVQLEAVTRAADLVVGGTLVARRGEPVEVNAAQREAIERDITEYLGEP